MTGAPRHTFVLKIKWKEDAYEKNPFVPVRLLHPGPAGCGLLTAFLSGRDP
jgi:hypothetical protein